jgi:hypothetical protein
MPKLFWIGAGWFILSVPVALVAGRLLRRVSAQYPAEVDPADAPNPWTDPSGPCVAPGSTLRPEADQYGRPIVLAHHGRPRPWPATYWPPA